MESHRRGYGPRDRLRIAEKLGATRLLLAHEDPVEYIREATRAKESTRRSRALGQPSTFENALRVIKPGGILSSVGVYSGHLRIPLEAFGAGLQDQTIVTTLCPGGKARMHRFTHLVEAGRIHLTRFLTYVFPLEEIGRAYALFEVRRDRVLKVAIRVS